MWESYSLGGLLKWVLEFIRIESLIEVWEGVV